MGKLVRDKIPMLMEASGQTPNIRILPEEEYTAALMAKLDEEVGEFHKDQNLEELADILEVVYALTENLGFSQDSLHAACQEKRRERGGFAGRIFLDT